MKHNLTLQRGLCVLLSLLMCLSLLPAAVLADEPAATADFTADANAALALLNAAKTEGSADSTWENNTLTLNGVNFTTSAGTAVKLPAGAKIVLAEGTTNTIASAADNADMSYGIYAAGDLAIEGNGTLIVRSAKATPSSNNGESCGIYAYDGDITISGGTIEATSGESSFCSSGIYVDDANSANGGNITISGGTVIAAGGTANASYGIISDQTITISGGHVTAQTVSTTGEKSALKVEPDLSDYSGYQWRTGASDDFITTAYTYSAAHTYVEFSSQSTVTTYTVTFNANDCELTEGSKTSIKTEADGTVVYLPRRNPRRRHRYSCSRQHNQLYLQRLDVGRYHHSQCKQCGHQLYHAGKRRNRNGKLDLQRHHYHSRRRLLRRFHHSYISSHCGAAHGRRQRGYLDR